MARSRKQLLAASAARLVGEVEKHKEIVAGLLAELDAPAKKPKPTKATPPTYAGRPTIKQ